MKIAFATLLLFISVSTRGQLVVKLSPPTITGQKVVVQLAMKNDLTNEVKSARAICLLLDEQGKMVGQSSKWVIGQNKTHLEPKGQAEFNFVITTSRSLVSTNLTAKVIFSRLILDGGKPADPRQ